MEESYICPNCGSIGVSRDIICPQCGHQSARPGGGSKLPIFIGGVVVGIIAAVGAVLHQVVSVVIACLLLRCLHR